LNPTIKLRKGLYSGIQPFSCFRANMTLAHKNIFKKS
jgi:hypothetical protein